MTSENYDDASIDPTTAVSVGRITSAHGLRGEIKVQPLTDFPNRFDKDARLWLDGQPIVVEGRRWQQASVVLKLQGIDSRTDAEALRGKELQVPQAQPIYEKDRYYLHDIIGLDVVNADGTPLGRLEDVLTTGANDVFVVHGEQGELLLPAVEDVIDNVDLEGRRVVVKLMPGLEFRPTRRRHT